MAANNLAKHQRQAFGLTICKNSHPHIRLMRKEVGEASIHGNKFWKSALVLIDYLSSFPPQKKRVRVLELGCGWGLAGIFCAKEFAARTTSLDADHAVMPALEYHALINDVAVEPWVCRFEKVRKQDLAEFDMIIASDVCFWDEMTKPLYNLINRAVKAGVKRVVITDPGREPFIQLADKCVEKHGAELEAWSVAHPHNTSGWVLDLNLK